MIGASYCRVSSEDQARHYSLPSQLDRILTQAGLDGCEIPSNYQISDQVTGTTLDRPGLKQLRDLVDQKAINVIYCLEPDRLSRNLAHLLILSDDFEAKGVKLNFILHPVEAGPEGRLFFQMRGVFSEYEREKLLERTKRGKLKRVEMGKISVSHAPYGYQYENGSLLVEPEQVDTIYRMFQWFIEDGLSTRAIAQKLITLGIPSPTGKRRWWNWTVAKILGSDTYAGTFYHNRVTFSKSSSGKPYTLRTIKPANEWIAIPCPAIVTKEWLDKAKAKLELNKHATGNPKRDYLLSGQGILFCQCGRRMGGAAKGPQGQYRYYRCTSNDRSAYPVRTCGTSLLNARKAESVVLEKLQALLVQPDLLRTGLESYLENQESEVARTKEDLSRVETRLKSLDNERQELVEWGLQKIFGEKTRDIIKTEAQKIETEEARLLNEKVVLEGKLSSHNARMNLDRLESLCLQEAENLMAMPSDVQKEIVGCLVQRAIWNGETLHLALIIPEELPMVQLKGSPWWP